MKLTIPVSKFKKIFITNAIKKTGTILRYLFSPIFLTIGFIGVGISLFNPLPYISQFLPINFQGITYIEQVAVQNIITFIQSQFTISISVFSMLVILGLACIAKEFYNGLKSFGRGIIESPMAIVRFPVKSYKSIVKVRNWILEKVDYLQTESNKWKTTFNILKAPYSLLRIMGFSPQMATTFLLAGSAVGGGVVVNETVFAERSFQRGDAGVYSAPLDTPIAYTEGDNTLRVDLGTTPVGNITIENITVGTAYANSALPSGETNVVIIGGKPAVVDPAFAETYLEVGHLIVDRWRCTELHLTNIEAHVLNISKNASDGQSIAPVAGTPRARGIGGGNRADAMITSGGYYDQIKLTSASSGINGKVDVLRLSNIYSKGGPCVLDRIKAGIVDILLNEVGAGDGFATKDFTVATSVIYKTSNIEDNVEVSISPPS